MASSTQVDKEPKRTKERSIKYIIEKVSQWRKLYNGYMDENHQLVRMSLEDAAEKVGVSKKSLDDYLSQLRQGRAQGYDFNKNKDQNVGHLRQFVKLHSTKNNKASESQAADDEQEQGAVLGKRSQAPQSLQRKESQRGGAQSKRGKR
jgi:hypothetical protein